MSIRYKLNDFLDSQNFKVIKEDDSDFFGDFYFIYSNGIINVRLISDRSIESLDLCNVMDLNYWFELTLIKAVITNEQDLLKITTINDDLNFLEEYFLEICELLNSQNFSSIKRKIEVLKDRRTNQLFSNC